MSDFKSQVCQGKGFPGGHPSWRHACIHKPDLHDGGLSRAPRMWWEGEAPSPSRGPPFPWLCSHARDLLVSDAREGPDLRSRARWRLPSSGWGLWQTPPNSPSIPTSGYVIFNVGQCLFLWGFMVINYLYGSFPHVVLILNCSLKISHQISGV